MPGPQFFETRMGHKFYEADVPRIAKALESIATSLAILAAQVPKPAAEMPHQPVTKGPPPAPSASQDFGQQIKEGGL